MENVGDIEDSEDDHNSSHSSSDDENMFKKKFGFLSVRSLQFMKSNFDKEREDAISKIDDAEIEKKNHKDSVIKEVDYTSEEVIDVEYDVYDLFIAANITKNVSPQQLNYCLEKCIYVFLIQILSSVGFIWDYKGFDNFQPFLTY